MARFIPAVTRISKSPPLLLIALPKGDVISPIIRDARQFAVCLLDQNERIMARLVERAQEGSTDPFMVMDAITLPSGITAPARIRAWFDCEMVRHLDIGGDSEVYIGMVHHASVVTIEETPLVRARVGTKPAPARPRAMSRRVR
ncbi:MAG: flavin reductase family protein [Planctomycetota bacterium]|nr:flavin reductase family protein [Planctomycetota bacterium]